MILNDSVLALANELRLTVQERTETVSEGEGVAMLMLYAFLADHARQFGLDLRELTLGQVGAFLDEVERGAVSMTYERAH
jgi:hypothetical protein